MLPQDAITKTIELIGIDDYNFFSGVSTILGVHNQQSGAQSNTLLLCGIYQNQTSSVMVMKTYDKDYSLNLINYVCAGDVWAKKTGQGDSAFLAITYLPYDYSLSTSTPVNSSYKFSGGELVISMFLLFIGMFLVFQFMIFKFFGIKIKKDI